MYQIYLKDQINPHILCEKTGNTTGYRKRHLLRMYYYPKNMEFVDKYNIETVHVSKYSTMIIAWADEEKFAMIQKDNQVKSITEHIEREIITHQTDIISRQIKADQITGSHSAEFPPYLGAGVKIGVISAENLTYMPNSPQLTGLEQDGRIVYLGEDTASEPSIHSSAVLSIIIGKSIEKEQIIYRGIAPESTVYFVPTFSRSQVYDAIEKCIDNGAVIINYSAGEAQADGRYDDFDRHIDILTYNVGFTFVTSAGNTEFISSPASSYNCICVGNAQTKSSPDNAIAEPYPMFYVSPDDASAYIQSEGLANKPDIASPGTYIQYIDSTGDILNLYGTSFSAPYVTSVAAQVAQKYPTSAFEPMLMKAILLCGARSDAISYTDNPTVGEFDFLRKKSGAGFVDSAVSLTQVKFIWGNADNEYSQTQKVELLQGQKLRLVLCYAVNPAYDATNNISIEIYNSRGTLAVFSDSPEENVKLIEYISPSRDEYTIRAFVQSGSAQQIRIPYGLAWRIIT